MIKNDRPMPARPQILVGRAAPCKTRQDGRSHPCNHWTPPQHGIAPHEFYGYRMPI